jgi:predicted PurR-regulated permease PerM
MELAVKTKRKKNGISNMEKQFNNHVRQIVFLVIIIFLACLIIGELKYFASSFLGGFTLYIMLKHPHRRLLEKGWNNTLATITLLAVAFILLVLILGGFILIVYAKLKQFQPQTIMDELHNIHNWIISNWGYNIFSEDIVQNTLSLIGKVLPNILSATGNVIANVIMMIFVLFFMLQESGPFERGLEKFFPVSSDSIQLLKKETNTMIFSNAVGIPLIMLGQGITAGLAYWILDAGDPVIWGLLTGFFGLLPVIGTGAIWLPLAVDLVIANHIWQGIVLIIYGICVISSVDNLVRMVFLKKKANIHPLITLFGVIMGMSLFGFWGIIFGPLIISVFFLFVKIYRKEFILK